MSGMLRYIREIRNIMNNTYIKDIKGYQEISRDMKDINQFTCVHIKVITDVKDIKVYQLISGISTISDISGTSDISRNMNGFRYIQIYLDKYI